MLETYPLNFTALEELGFSLWKLKNEFINQRETLLKDAHERRIESKNRKASEKQQTKQEERKEELDNLRQNKGEQRQEEQEIEL